MTRAIQYLVVAFAVANTSVRADDLFSEITIGSVFAAPGTVESDASVKANTGRRLSGVHSIRKTMANVGFVEVSDVTPDESGATFSVTQQEDASIKMRVALSNNKESIMLSATLTQLDKSNEKSARTLLGQNSDSTNNIRFVITDNTLQIQSTFENQDISPSRLKTKILELVDRAAASSSTWKPQGNKSAIVPKPNPAAISLTGQWSTDATKKTNYGIKFDGERFKLGVVVNSRFSKSEGTWSIVGDQLTLAGEGLRLSGKLTLESAEQFILTINNQRLKFAKSN